jgi:hypothetical protein
LLCNRQLLLRQRRIVGSQLFAFTSLEFLPLPLHLPLTLRARLLFLPPPILLIAILL